MTADRPGAISLDDAIEARPLPSGRWAAAIPSLGIEGTGVNEDDARAGAQRAFLAFLRDPKNAEALGAFVAVAPRAADVDVTEAELAAHGAAAEAADSHFEPLDEGQFDSWIAGRIVLVYFSAPWCGPCRTLAPRMVACAHTLGLALGKIDVDAVPALADRFVVQGLPTVLLLRDGHELERIVGARLDVSGLVDRIRVALANS